MLIAPIEQQTINLPIAMTVPLWGLVIFILWTIASVALLITVRMRHLATGGDVKDFGTPDNDSLLWRLFRVQSNLVENLPLYLGVVVLLTLREISGLTIDLAIECYLIFRILHSVIHIAGLNPLFRIVCLAVQFGCLIFLTVLAVL
jgi:uncharacterized membrane protein YecN with MAPEG domain